ncbi:MAG TPA: cation-transporting P-type ATPase [Thermoguttaceae bacterium]|nr:cation-transporting P-type ATPase [Thermoguttaceae bacterium]
MATSSDPWHGLPAEQVVSQLGTSAATGLDLAEVERRQAEFGPNTPPQKREPGPLITFLKQSHQALVYILILCGVVSAMFHDWAEAAVIFGVVLVNAVVGFVQERKASKALSALRRSMSTTATVLREGAVRSVPSEELVPGDLVLLKSGDKVPGDLRLLYARDLMVDESALTGESMPVTKQTHVLAGDVVLADRENMAYSSTLVTYGQGQGVVVATGATTELGRISQLIAGAEELATPLTRNIAHFSRLLFFVILACALLTFLLGVVRGQEWIYMLQAAVALAVGAVPEALPAAVSVTLAIGVARMAKRHAIIRKLPAVETLGSTSVICSDKTGTLTENQLTVRIVWAGGCAYEISGTGFAPVGEIAAVEQTGRPPGRNDALGQCLAAGVLCNEAALEEQDGRWLVRGDPTEGALVVSARKAGVSEVDLAEQLPRIDAIPFESQNKYSATLHDPGEGEAKVVLLKGAVDTILPRCTEAMDADGQPHPIDRDQVHAVFEDMATRGLRVLAMARRELPSDAVSLAHADLEGGFTLLGLQGMSDPPRAEAIAAVKTCQRAGIHVKMVTGDHAINAAVVARQLGLSGFGETEVDPAAVVTGDRLAAMSEEELAETADRASVFARVSPEQKLLLVKGFQARDHVVAMTGDGVNDAPALKQADVGVAMGIGGTEVAKEAADMVLTDDNFATIEAAVEEGRGVFDSLTKFIVWTLPTNLGDGLVIMAAILAGVALPILPLQILWINMNAAVLLGLVLAFEPKEPGIMLRKPRDPREPILTRTLIERIVLVGLILLAGAFGLFWGVLQQGLAAGKTEPLALAEARTVATNFFVFVQLFYMFNCRSLTKSMFEVGLFSNPWIWLGAALMVALQMGYTYLPVMNRLFDSAPIGYVPWIWIVGLALVGSVIVGLEKHLRRLLTSSN